MTSQNKILFSSFFSRFGDAIDSVAYSWLVYQLTNSISLVALIAGVSSLPNIIFGFFSGALLKKFNKKYIVVLSDLLRGLLLLIVVILYLKNSLEVYHLFIFAIVNSTVETLGSSSSMAIVKSSVEEDEMSDFLGKKITYSRSGEVLGLVVGGFSIGLIGIHGCLIIDSITFFLSSLIIFFIPYKEEILSETKEIVGFSGKKILSDSVASFNIFLNDKTLFFLVSFGVLITSLLVPINSFLTPYVKSVLEKEPIYLTIISTSMILGLTISGMVSSKILKKLSSKDSFILSGAILGLSYISIGILPNYLNFNFFSILISSVFFIMGFSIVPLQVVIQKAFISAIPREEIVAASGIFSAFVMASTPLVNFLLAPLSKVISLTHIFMTFGVLIIILFSAQRKNKVLISI